ncbi:hypothetical protein C5167_047177 [Papaver somniferum]|uniref:Uncharacterized protein n=1 Tax=Papaver somniferum TaxID=3469 RepID=A0A4Y7LID8_PAPSO|nr:hypothetical protein C5167_047177 [Papaver somniferum]
MSKKQFDYHRHLTVGISHSYSSVAFSLRSMRPRMVNNNIHWTPGLVFQNDLHINILMNGN